MRWGLAHSLLDICEVQMLLPITALLEYSILPDVPQVLEMRVPFFNEVPQAARGRYDDLWPPTQHPLLFLRSHPTNDEGRSYA